MRDAGDPVSGAPLDPPQFLDVDVQQFAGSSSLVALRGLRTKTAELAVPIRVKIPETVDSAIPRHSVISRPGQDSPTLETQMESGTAPPSRPLYRDGGGSFAARLAGF